MRWIVFLLISALLAGCTANSDEDLIPGGVPVYHEAAEPYECDPNPAERIMTNGDVVPQLRHEKGEMAKRLAAALGVDFIGVRNLDEPFFVQEEDGMGMAERFGRSTLGAWDTSNGILSVKDRDWDPWKETPAEDTPFSWEWHFQWESDRIATVEEAEDHVQAFVTGLGLDQHGGRASQDWPTGPTGHTGDSIQAHIAQAHPLADDEIFVGSFSWHEEGSRVIGEMRLLPIFDWNLTSLPPIMTQEEDAAAVVACWLDDIGRPELVGELEQQGRPNVDHWEGVLTYRWHFEWIAGPPDGCPSFPIHVQNSVVEGAYVGTTLFSYDSCLRDT